MPFTSIAEFEATESPTPAETELIEACRAGNPCILGDGILPPTAKPSPDRDVRAKLLRLLILGGTPDCGLHQSGVWLEGGYIAGELDLNFAKARSRCVLHGCRFSEKPQFAQTEFAQLSLERSHLPGLVAPGVKVETDLVLRNITATGTVDMNGARIGGQMDCDHARLNGMGAQAFHAQRLVVNADLFLRHLTAVGTINLNGAKIGGQVTFENSKLDGDGDRALTGQAMRVEDFFIWSKIGACSGRVNLNTARVATLVDDADSWAKVNSLNLDGFTYDRIIASATDAKTRLKWLYKGSVLKGKFHPQPYTQLAKVLQEMGHDRAARQVKIEREVLTARQVRADRSVVLDGTWGTGFRSLWFDIQNLTGRVWDFVLRHGAGYGYRPGNSVLALVVLWAVASWLASATWDEGAFAPNSDVILVSEGWQAALAADCIPPALGCDTNPAETWANDPKRGMDWDSFSAAAYGADLVVPILDLGQTAAWAPSKDRGTYGKILWWGRWWLEALGWLATGLGAAAITGVIKRKEE
jgi:hypothetical protein